MRKTLRRCGLIASLWFFAVLASACHHPSGDMQYIEHFDRSEWSVRVQVLPIERRLDLFQEVYHLRHPPDLALANAFRKEPSQSLSSIYKRMESSSPGIALTYLPILSDLESSGSARICRTNQMIIIRNMLSKKHYDEQQREAIATWAIGKCSVALQ